MRRRQCGPRVADRWRLGLVVAGCISLAACGGGQSVSRLSEQLFGGQPTGTTTPNAGDQGASDQPSASYFEAVSLCPRVEVRAGTESFRVYERGGEEDASRVRFQGSITDAARECRNAGSGSIAVHVGVSGRLIAGPKGGAGSVDVPIRVAVLKDSTEVVYSKLHTLPVTLAAPTFGQDFTLVDDQVTFAVDPAASYRVFVGFDERDT